jgi:hypothetical protein
MTYVTCPILRYHPAVVAQKAAAMQILSGGRFRLGAPRQLAEGALLTEAHLAARSRFTATMELRPHGWLRLLLPLLREEPGSAQARHRTSPGGQEDRALTPIPQRPTA